MTYFAWTDDRIEQLKQLWASKLSASQIAKEMGCGSRSAVIGKVHRLGLPGREKIVARKADGRFGRNPNKRQLRPRKTVAEIAKPLCLPVEPVVCVDDPAAIPVEQRCDLLGLKPGRCRWPVGDPRDKGFFFCGGKAVPGLPYCAGHRRIAYQPAGKVNMHRVPA